LSCKIQMMIVLCRCLSDSATVSSFIQLEVAISIQVIQRSSLTTSCRAGASFRGAWHLHASCGAQLLLSVLGTWIWEFERVPRDWPPWRKRI
jgi:hypothetical protein